MKNLRVSCHHSGAYSVVSPADPRLVARADRVDPEADVAVPAEAPANKRVFHQVCHVDHQLGFALLRPAVQVVDNATAQVALKRGVALPQVGQQRLAGQLMHRDAGADPAR